MGARPRPARKSRASMAATITLPTADDQDPSLTSELNNNPLMMIASMNRAATPGAVDPTAIDAMTTPPDAVAWAHIKASYTSMAADLARVNEELRASRLIARREESDSSLPGSAKPVLPTAPRSRTEFRPSLAFAAGESGVSIANPMDKYRSLDNARGAAALGTKRTNSRNNRSTAALLKPSKAAE
jgi:hypothetical protein